MPGMYVRGRIAQQQVGNGRAAAAAGRAAQRRRTIHGHGRGRGRQTIGARHQAGRLAEQPVDRARRPEAGRAGDRRRVPADPSGRHRQAGGVERERARRRAGSRCRPPAADRVALDMSKFFIERPIFAIVIALFILVFGGVAITQLPIAQYPPVAPPTIVLTATYPGASAKTMDEAVDQRRRAGAQRLARHDLHGVGEPVQRHRHHHHQLRAGHQPRPRAGGRAEPPVARGPAPARGRHAAGRTRRQGALQLPAVHDPVVRQPGPTIRWRWATTRRATCCPRSSGSPASARRSCSAPSARCACGSTRPSSSATSCR